MAIKCTLFLKVMEALLTSTEPFLVRQLERYLMGNLIGVQLTHKWEQGDQGVSQYSGRTIKRVPAAKQKSALYTISYWAEGEDNAEDFSHLTESLVVDFVGILFFFLINS